MSFADHATAPSSEKVILAWLGAAQRLMVWQVHAGSVYKKTVPEFVTGVTEDGTVLTQVASIGAINSAGKWYFDIPTKVLYVRSLGSVDPESVFTRGHYRIFASNGPFILPWDLATGEDVEYLPIIAADPEFPYEIDPEQFGVSLESIGNIPLINTDGYFDSRYERYWWENKDVQVFAWSPTLPISERKRIYRGIITDKGFTPAGVTFQVRDFIAKLQGNLSLPVFDGTEGTIQPGYVGSQKRRLYGRVSGLRCVGIDHVLDGYAIEGQFSSRRGLSVIVGTADFLDQVCPGDDLVYRGVSYRAESVQEQGPFGTEVTVSSELEDHLDSELYPGEPLLVRPRIPWRKKNRQWLIAGHALKKISAEITSVISARRFRIDEPEEFRAGDVITVGVSQVQIRRMSGDLVILEQDLGVIPSIGDTLSRSPVQGANVGTTELIAGRDFTLLNSADGAILYLSELAEFNLAPASPMAGLATFTNGSRTVTGTGFFTQELDARAWVRAPLGTWYEVSQVVSDTELKLCIPFAQTTATSVAAERKNPSLFTDDSIVTVDCFGKTEDGDEDGVWIKTGPHVVKDLLSDAGISDAVDEDAFAEASEDAYQLMSLALPLSYGGNANVSIKESIDLVNQTVLGALSYGEDYDLEYNILMAKKPADLVALEDVDIISWEAQTRTNHIVRDFIVRYKHQDADRVTGQEGFSTKSVTNEIAQRLSDTTATRTQDIYLYNDIEAEITARRLALLNESGSTRISVTAKLNLTTKRLAEKGYFNLDRLFHRLGSEAHGAKIGVITKVQKSGRTTLIEVDDLSGIWNKVACIAANGSSAYAAASDDAKIRNGYITNENGIITGNESTYRSNIIG